MKIPVDSITVDPSIQIRQRLHEDAVLRYMDAFDELPPVVVFETSEGRLLSDGMHRIAAANRLGRWDIEAEIRKGTRADAEEHAITANTKNAMPLTAGERDEGIRRLKARGDGLDTIAKKMSLPLYTIERVIGGQQVKAELEGRVTRPLPSRSHYEELARVPEDIREPVALAAAEQGWNSVQLRDVAKIVADPEIPEAQKQQLLTGSTTPQAVSAWGQILKGAEKAAREDPLANLYAALKAIDLIKAHLDPAMFADAEQVERLRLYNQLEEALATLRRVQQYAQDSVAVPA
jgi:hypothetical protein